MTRLFFLTLASLLIVADDAASKTITYEDDQGSGAATISTVPKPCVEDFLRPVRIEDTGLPETDEWYQIETSMRDWLRGGATPCGLEDVLFFQFRRPQ